MAVINVCHGISTGCKLVVLLSLTGHLILSHCTELGEEGNDVEYCLKDDNNDCQEERDGVEYCSNDKTEGCFWEEDEEDFGAEFQGYDHLTYLQPDDIEEVFNIKLAPGKKHQMTSKGISPPIYEIPNFLTDEECDYLIEKAKAAGMSQSGVFGDDIKVDMNINPPEEVSRISQQTWLYNNGDAVVKSIYDRLAKLTNLPKKFIDDSEAMQVVNYEVGGHYHAHMDTTEMAFDDEEEMLRQDDLPCCFQARCDHFNLTDMLQCCKLCRYMTVLYYLNDVEDGGETAFPFPDVPLKYIEELMESDKDILNLSKNCDESFVVIKPEKGKAVMWYNHEINLETGLLGDSIISSYHGSCDVKKGTKWIANNWISAPPYEHREKPSIFNV